MTGEYGALIRQVGLVDYLAQFDARKMTKAAILEELEQVAKELLASNRMKDASEAAVKNLEGQLHGVKGDCRRAEEVADDLIRRLEAERVAHNESKRLAARTLHSSALIFGAASPDIPDAQRDGPWRGGLVRGGGKRLMGEVGPEAVSPRRL